MAQRNVVDVKPIKVNKKELKKPDAFMLTVEKTWSQLERSKGFILSVTALIVLVAIVSIIVDLMAQRAERKAAEEFFQVEAKYSKIKTDFEKAKSESLRKSLGMDLNKDKDKDKDKDKEKDKKEPEFQSPTGDLQKDYASVVPDLEKIITEKKGTTVAAQAALILGHLQFEYKNPEKARETLTQSAAQLKSNQLLYGLTHMLLGTVQADLNHCPEAVDSWKKVLGSDRVKTMHAEARLRSGVCLESMNQSAQALDFYRQVIEQNVDPETTQKAKTMMRALALNSSAGSSGLPGGAASPSSASPASGSVPSVK